MAKFYFGDIVREVKEKVDRNNNPYKYYIAGEHMDTDELHLHRRGTFAGSDVGPAFIRVFRPGQVLYGSRRTYLRKVAVADFEGVTANTTFVLESKDEGVLLQGLLPFIMQSERFTQHSIKRSKGSTNPYVLFSDLCDYELELPDIDEQHTLSRLLWAMDATKQAYKKLLVQTDELVKSQFIEMLGGEHGWGKSLLKEAYVLQMGKTPARENKKYWNSADYKWISIADLSSYGKYTGDTKECISREAVNEAGMTPVPKDTVIMSFKLTIGKTAITAENVFTNEAIMAFLPKRNDIKNDYLRFCLTFHDWSAEAKKAVKGVTLNKESIGGTVITIPPVIVQEQFADFVRQIDKSKFQYQTSSLKAA